MEKMELKSLFTSVLLPCGFKRKGPAWYRQKADILQVVDLQKSDYGLQYYLNLCFVPAGMTVPGMPTPKEVQCPIRLRLDDVYPRLKNEIEKMFDLENTSFEDTVRQEKISGLLKNRVLKLMESMTNNQALRDAIENGVFRGGMVTGDAMQHLGLHLPEDESSAD